MRYFLLYLLTGAVTIAIYFQLPVNLQISEVLEYPTAILFIVVLAVNKTLLACWLLKPEYIYKGQHKLKKCTRRGYHGKNKLSKFKGSIFDRHQKHVKKLNRLKCERLLKVV